MGSHGQLNGVGDRNRQNHLLGLSGLALGLAASLMLAGPVEARNKQEFSLKVSKLEIAEANASAEGPLGPEDFVRARLDYVLSRRDRGGKLEIRAKVWAVKPFSSEFLPIQVVPNEPFAKRKGSVEVLVRLKQAYVEENVAHPLRLVFVLTQWEREGRFSILAATGRLELETQLQRMAWNDPAKMEELVASGEPLPLTADAGITRPVRIKGEEPRGSEGDLLAGCFRLTVAADGTVQDVETLHAATADASVDSQREFRSWRFQPATYQGKPVAVTYRYCFNAG